uniref:hypothetical protein n=1 Tax=Nocardia donostiensis TaxID=1538463 RepID=UPI001FEB5D3E|nr:hypothetical protein [Nocardia donostiensis]
MRAEPDWIDYAEFGRRFVTHAVNSARIEAAIAGIAGRGMTFGPFSLGPTGLAGFMAEGKVGRPIVVHRGPQVTFEVRIPVSLALKVLLGGKKLRVETIVSIDLTLDARTADPLLIVIDIPRVQPADVRVVLRAQAVESVGEWLLDPIAGVVQREVAHRVNTMLADPRARRARIFDIEAIVAGVSSAHRHRIEFDWIDYEEFGRRFFPLLVTRERVQDVVQRLAGRPIEIGPVRTGPRDSATLTVRGAVRDPEVSDVLGDGPEPRFDLRIPVSLDITVDVLKANRYHADVVIALRLVARAADPLLIVIDVAPPSPEDIGLEFAAHGVRAATLGKLAGIKKQVIAQVAKVVRRELADPAIRTIDAGARIDRLV